MTERKRMEEALHKSEELYRSLVAHVGLGTIDLSGKFTFVNKAFCELTGYSQGEMLGKIFADFIYVDDRQAIMKLFDYAPTYTKDTDYSEFRLDNKQGRIVYAGATISAIKYNNQLIGFNLLIVDNTVRKRLEGNTQFYISEIIMAQEEERRRIARELHDEIAQSLALLLLELDVILRDKIRLTDDISQRLVLLRSQMEKILEDLRRFSHHLRSPLLSEAGFLPALESLIQELMNIGGINARLQIAGDNRRMSTDAEMLVFRIAQESLRNVRKHSQATEVVVLVEFAPQKVRLTITDNGQGFKLPERWSNFASRGKLGLIGMGERARLLNADLLIRSEVGKGTTVSLELATQEKA